MLSLLGPENGIMSFHLNSKGFYISENGIMSFHPIIIQDLALDMSQNVVHGEHDSKLGHKSDNKFCYHTKCIVLFSLVLTIGVLTFCCSACGLIYP